MDKNKLQTLKEMLGLLNRNTASPEELANFLKSLVESIRQTKATLTEENSKTSQELKIAVNNALTTLEEGEIRLKSALETTLNTKVGSLEVQTKDVLKRAIKALETINSIEVKDGEPGKNPDPNEVVPLVLKQIKFPEQKYDTGQEIVGKINTTDSLIDIKNIGGLNDLEKRIKSEVALPMTTMFVNGSRAKNLAFTGATVNVAGDTATVTITGGGGGGTWGSITGTLSNQTDLQTALDAKQDDITLTTTGSSGAATLIGNTLNIPNYAGPVVDGSGTANQLTYWVDSDTLGALAVATYPSLTELSYVKGVTSAIQTQLNSKIGLTSLSATLPLLYDNTTGVFSTSRDYIYINSAESNTAVGYTAGNSLTTSSNNVAVGAEALTAHTDASGGHTAVGSGALKTNTTGTLNTAVGYNAMATSNGADNSVAVGYNALIGATGDQNTAIGAHSLGLITSGQYNTAVGYFSLRQHATGDYNTALGHTAMSDNTGGARSTGIGASALNQGGSTNDSTAVGAYALTNVFSPGHTNTALGAYALTTLATGANNVGLGYSAGRYETGSNAIYLDNLDRSNTAGDKAGALFYGVTDATPANQTSTINATLKISQALELGHATDTTISRVSAGVVAIEGVNILTTATGQPLDTQLTSVAGLSYTGNAGKFMRVNAGETDFELATVSGSGDMVLASAQTNSGIKTFLDTTMKLRNVANTFDGYFVNTNTANRIYTLKDAAGTLAFTTDITGTNSGTNTGDQTSVTGNAGTVTTNANLTGPITSVGNATSIASSVALPGSPTTTTQSPNDNSTKIATTAYTDAAVIAGTIGLLDYRGSYDASTNLFPATGGSGIAGAILKGDFWIVSVGGTLGGTATTPGDLVIALIDTPAQTAANWDVIAHNLGSYVTSVTGTTNRITSSGGATPSIDIAATYVGQTSITTLGTLTTGTWNATVVAGQYGGTGVANTGKTITLGGNLNTSGAFNTTLTVTGSNTITFPNASITVARTDAAQTFTGVQTFSTPIAVGSVATMTATVGGAVPTPPNNTTTFLRGDGTFAAPAGGGGAATTKDIAQTTHGFAVNDIVKFSGTTYQKAKADSAANAEVVGIVTAVADANNFTLTMEGYVSGLTALTSDTVYFLSAATAGLLTATEPTTAGQVSVPLIKMVSTTTGYFEKRRGIVIAAPSSSITKTFTAQENLTAGNPVGVSNLIANKVSRANRTSSTAAHGITTPLFVSQRTANSCSIGGDKFVYLQYTAAGSDTLFAQVGSIDPNTLTLTLGAAQTVATAFTPVATTLLDACVCKLDTDKFIVFYLADASAVNIQYRIGTVSGTTITFGTAATAITAGSTAATSKGFNADFISTDKGIFSFKVITTTTNAKMVAFTASGTVATFGSGVTPGAQSQLNNPTFIKTIGTDKFVLVTQNVANSLYAQVCTLSGTVITAGSELQISTSTAALTDAGFQVVSPATDVFVVRVTGASSNINITACTVSTITITAGTTVVTTSALDAGGGGMWAQDASTLYVTSVKTTTDFVIQKFTLSGAVITDAGVSVRSFSTGLVSTSANETIYMDNGYPVVFNHQNVTNVSAWIYGMANNYIGIAQSTVSAAAADSVILYGVDANQTNLQPGSVYLVSNGSLSLVSSVVTISTLDQIDTVTALSSTEIEV